MAENKNKLDRIPAETDEVSVPVGAVDAVETEEIGEVPGEGASATQEVDVYETAEDILLEVGHEAEPQRRREKETGILGVGLPLFIICAVVALVVSFVHAITADVIAEAEMREKREAIARIFGEAEIVEMETPEEAEALYAVGDAGWCVNLLTGGFGGDIALMVGVNTDGTVRGVEIISHSETPGFGAKADDPAYLAQYVGLSDKLVLGMDVSAISGATISSRAILNGVNDALDVLRALSLIAPAAPRVDTSAEDKPAMERIFGELPKMTVRRAPAGAEALYVLEGMGCAVRLSTPGYGGDITLLVGIDSDGVVSGVEILSHSESRWNDDPYYLYQYIGVSADVLTEDVISTVSGATVSSRAIMAGVAEALEIAASAGLIPAAETGR